MQEDAQVESTEHLPKTLQLDVSGDALHLEDFALGKGPPSVSFKGLSRSSAPRPFYDQKFPPWQEAFELLLHLVVARQVFHGLPDGSTNRLWIWLRRAVAHVATSSCLDPARAPGDVAAYADHEAAHRAHSLACFRGLPAASAPALALGAVLRGALEKEDRGILETHLAHAGGYGPPHLRPTAVVFVKLHAA